MKVNLTDLMEAQFLLNYYCNVSVDDFNHLPTYEFKSMMRLLQKYKSMEAEANNPRGNLGNMR